MGIPWSWLGLYPQPDMVLDALFLLPDSDQPTEALRNKVRQSNKWIWWQGKVQLKGQPPGLRQLPKQQVIAEIAEKTREITVPKVVAREEKEKDREEQDGQDSVVVEQALGEQERILAEADSGDARTVTAARRSQEAVQTAAVPALRSRLNRSLLAKRHRAPDWVRALNDDEEVSPRPSRFSLL